MKVHQQAKRRSAHQPVYRVRYLAHRYHPAWSGDVEPTPATVPDAFNEDWKQVNARPDKPRTRKQPHWRLGVGALKKRIASAGVRGPRVAQIAREIHAGPDVTQEVPFGLRVMGWSVDVLRERFGRRVVKKVSRFVTQYLVVLDEYGYYMAGSPVPMPETLRAGLESAQPVVVTQSSSDFA